MHTVQNEFLITIKFYYGMLVLVYLLHNHFFKDEFQKKPVVKKAQKVQLPNDMMTSYLSSEVFNA